MCVYYNIQDNCSRYPFLFTWCEGIILQRDETDMTDKDINCWDFDKRLRSFCGLIFPCAPKKRKARGVINKS